MTYKDHKKRAFAQIRAREDGWQHLSEKEIEKRFVEAVKAMGGKAPKFVSPGWDGVPDRLVLLPGGRMAFVEMKALSRALRPLQERRKKQLEALGFKVFCINDPRRIEEVLSDIGGEA